MRGSNQERRTGIGSRRCACLYRVGADAERVLRCNGVEVLRCVRDCGVGIARHRSKVEELSVGTARNTARNTIPGSAGDGRPTQIHLCSSPGCSQAGWCVGQLSCSDTPRSSHESDCKNNTTNRAYVHCSAPGQSDSDRRSIAVLSIVGSPNSLQEICSVSELTFHNEQSAFVRCVPSSNNCW